MLAIVPTAGLDAVLVAVELALESGPPSGRFSVEHVSVGAARALQAHCGQLNDLTRDAGMARTSLHLAPR